MKTKLLAAVLGTLAMTLPGCAAPAARGPLAVASTPRTPLPAEDAGPLFWDRETRTDRFRHTEDFYPGLETAAAPRVRELPRGASFDTDSIAAIERQMEALGAAGMIVLQDGRVRYENYRLGFRPEQRWTSFSVAKSFTSTLLGAAVKERKLALSDLASRHLPGLTGTAYDGVTVEQIATMTSGVAWNEDYTSPQSDVARFLTVTPVAGEPQSVTYARSLKRAAPAGEKWLYNTLETNLLGDIVAAATGRTLADYAKEKIVDPAGFAGGLYWMTDLTGRNIAGCCLSIRLSDYARMGQWVMEGGQPTVPTGWFERAGSKQADIGAGAGMGYGYQWWTNADGFAANGIFGQHIAIMPERRLVIAIVSSNAIASGRPLTAARTALVNTVMEAAQ